MFWDNYEQQSQKYDSKQLDFICTNHCLIIKYIILVSDTTIYIQIKKVITDSKCIGVDLPVNNLCGVMSVLSKYKSDSGVYGDCTQVAAPVICENQVERLLVPNNNVQNGLKLKGQNQQHVQNVKYDTHVLIFDIFFMWKKGLN